MSSYELSRESPIVLSNIERFYGGARLPIESGELESSVFDVVPGKRRYIALTAYDATDQAIAICDFMNNADTKFGVLESPIIRKRPDLAVPAMDLRVLADDDGIYIVEAFRKKHVGAVLLKTALELSKRYGSTQFVVKHGDKQAGWYRKLGGQEVLGGFLFNL
ncbi:MAG: GNAT family N-acetyltransferase [Patescibacteria group bacterium]